MIRFGVSMEEGLLSRFDEAIARSGQANRSEAVRDLVRRRLVEDRVRDPEAKVLGVLTLVYDHHRQDLQDRLVALQHDHLDVMIATTHVHVDHHHCLEVVLLRGRAGSLRDLAATLAGIKGVHHSDLTLTAVGAGGES
jgi:CopG family nickel-responsive transcriptional regulator